MPEDKKNQQKGRSDAKEQRRPRQGRQKAGDKHAPAVEKKAEEPQVAVQQKPVYEDPGPEFYKNLKRETDEILKITEEANSKYKKKEILSNWTKYEMPIETYEEIEEHDVGADYEKLIQMPLSVGGHFQFKHEKSWDVSTGPSLYDKYFDIDMNDLANALCTIPFYDRNLIDKDIFNESEILTMDNRATRYKQKYYNDKSFTTPELEAQDKILKSLEEALSKPEIEEHDDTKEIDFMEENLPPATELTKEEPVASNGETEIPLNNVKTDVNTDAIVNQKDNEQANSSLPLVKPDFDIDDVDDLLENEDTKLVNKNSEMENAEATPINLALPEAPVVLPSKPEVSNITETTKNPVIESPEDLEKWLDDFLDG